MEGCPRTSCGRWLAPSRWPRGAGRGCASPCRAPCSSAPGATGSCDCGSWSPRLTSPSPCAPAGARTHGARRTDSVLVAEHVDVARAKRRDLAGPGVVGVAPDAAGVVGQQVDRDRGVPRGRAHAVDVVGRRDERVEVAGRQRAALDELDAVAALGVDVLVLGPAVEADEAPGEVG